MSVLSDLWLTPAEAGQVLSEANGRFISPDYLRVLSRRGKIQTQVLSRKMNLYYAPDCRQCQIKAHGRKGRQS